MSTRSGALDRVPLWFRGLVASIAAHVIVLVFLCHQPAKLGWTPGANQDSQLAQRFEHSSDAIQLLNLGPAGVRNDAGIDMSQARPDPALLVNVAVTAELPKPMDVPSDPVVAASKRSAAKEQLRCEVRVHQNPYGRVEAFELGDCEGDAAWRETMSKVMQRAAALVTPASQPDFAALRTIILEGSEISPSVVALRLSAPDPNGESFIRVLSQPISMHP